MTIIFISKVILISTYIVYISCKLALIPKQVVKKFRWFHCPIPENREDKNVIGTSFVKEPVKGSGDENYLLIIFIQLLSN